MRKTPISKDIDLNFVAQITEGFSGADLTEICQKAAKAAIRDSIEADVRMRALIQQGGRAQKFDPVPEITRKHFEEALKTARKSVTATDLDKFEQFKRKFDPSFVSKGNNSQGGPKINWPGATNVTGQGGKMQVEDDLYN